jgi:hypothetical protein
VAGQICSGNPNPCKQGVTQCGTGSPVCANGAANIPAGTACGTNQVCNGTGTCVSCTAGVACTGNPTFCKQGVTSCLTGAAVCVDGSNKANTTVCRPAAGVCDQAETCSNGVCPGDSKVPAGTVCNPLQGFSCDFYEEACTGTSNDCPPDTAPDCPFDRDCCGDYCALKYQLCQ